jgi:hypothetical protein
VEYPNAWYFRQVFGQEPLFRDWVVLLIDPDFLWSEGTRFCARNAAAESGRLVRSGYEGFEAMYAPAVLGARATIYKRSQSHLPAAPTDNQAEVLIPDNIPLARVFAIGVRSEDQASREAVRLEILGVTECNKRFIVAPDFYDPSRLSDLIANGRRPNETEWQGV